jgi:4-hydroxyphenylpyruvate dioxygenase
MPNGVCVEGIHHVEFYVANNVETAQFYERVLGFDILGSVSGAAALSDRSSIAVQRADIRLLLTAPLTTSSRVARHLALHGEGIKDIALHVRDVDGAFEAATAAGAAAVSPPADDVIDRAAIRIAQIGTCGDLVHTLVSEPPSGRQWVSGVAGDQRRGNGPDTAVDAIDHIALALPAGDLDRWVDFYVDGLGFRDTHQEQVSTEFSAMRSRVVQSRNGAVRFPMMEPAPGKRISQIESYVQHHHGAGAQHLALRSRDIITSVSIMADGIQFLPTPRTYYASLPARVGDLSSDLEALERHGILVDRDATGILLQVFTKPIGNRPTLFIEVIERRGAEGFGSGNIKALFEAVERMEHERLVNAASREHAM